MQMQWLLTLPLLAAMAAESGRLTITVDDNTAWSYPGAVVEKLGWDSPQVRVSQSAAAGR